MKYLFWLFGILLSTQVGSQSDLKIVNLKTEYKINPIGIDNEVPRLYWQLQTGEKEKNVMQTHYQIQVAHDPLFSDLKWDSGKIASDESIHLPYEGSPLESKTRYYWRVKGWDNHKRVSAWSAVAFWEMGMQEADDWKGKWITNDWEEKEKAHNPCPLFRKEFRLNKEISQARLYITARGLYQAKINGSLVTEDLFTPGWTSYHNRIQYQTYDVTDLVSRGDNAVGVTLGDGWYRGQFGFRNNWNVYGKQLALCAQLEIKYRDGSSDMIISDENWKAHTGPIDFSSIYDGEQYDARKLETGWDTPGFNDSQWSSVSVIDTIGHDHLVGPEGPPVRKKIILEPAEIITTPAGEKVLDFGQNMVGWVAFSVEGEEGDSVVLSHAEVLDDDGNFYTENLRSADQKIKYILKGEGIESYEPLFTFQGFRYIRVDSWPGSFTEDNFKGIVIFSDLEQTGKFECSDSLINQLQENILWGQRGNFLDVPTDCPQRDERMGWTGDAQAFAPTACYNFSSAAFFTKWLQDLKLDQEENGSVPFVIPDVLDRGGSIGWGDAATIIPWTLYTIYGDKRILSRQYESMKAWVSYLDNLAGSNRLVQDGFHFGDWLFFIHPTQWNVKPGYTDIDFLGTAFFAYSTEICRNTAELLGQKEDLAHFDELLAEIKQAFREEFVSKSGRLSPHSQTAYTIALAFGLLEPEQEEKAIEYLVQNIVARNYHLSTGFLGTPHLTQVLSDKGKLNTAYRLLLQKEYPSWLYPVTKGATTIWERWDGIKPDGTFQNVRMNSFNHYAYGAIGYWMYSELVGIRPDPKNPGFKSIIIEPKIDPLLSYASSSHQSLYGPIRVKWELDGDMVDLEVVIPPNTKGKIVLPLHPENIEELVGSGQYNYRYKADLKLETK